MKAIPVQPGELFGDWTVTESNDAPKSRTYCKCRCKCGYEQSIRVRDLSTGQTTQCKRCSGQSRRQPLPIGSVIGQWTVTGGPVNLKGEHRFRQPCKCICGKTANIQRSVLASGHSNQCKDCANMRYHNIVGQTFGALTVLRRLPREERRSQNAPWLCRCNCGSQVYMTSSRLKRCQIGCQLCAAKVNGLKYRLRPHESLYRLACRLVAVSSRGLARNFGISYEEFVFLISTGKCHYCHVPLVWPEHSLGKNGSGVGYQLDRKDNSLGYTFDNVVTCCWRCNVAKGNRFTYDQWWTMTTPFREGPLDALSCRGSLNGIVV
jgi:hypothetical protein